MWLVGQVAWSDYGSEGYSVRYRDAAEDSRCAPCLKTKEGCLLCPLIRSGDECRAKCWLAMVWTVLGFVFLAVAYSSSSSTAIKVLIWVGTDFCLAILSKVKLFVACFSVEYV